ncbi:argininosuccinate lyase [Maliponia aquimaris]|uniref:Argininosuccinate lyase n=1 Tax=Maliponia aquimaris TaxID=1673631 RepID=A0A238JNA8_9RHOB|nr:argininosuccinate lyase [Maliponia aquimaris]SMX31975.1 hypothetical protein MAA8898_00101 [Maliponia aquimaris]
MRALSILALLALAACGADGEPEKPAAKSGPGVTVSVTGKAEIGIAR